MVARPATPHPLPSAVVAKAPHRFAGTRITNLQALVPHWLNANRAARSSVG
jgi:hypothetical protein